MVYFVRSGDVLVPRLADVPEGVFKSVEVNIFVLRYSSWIYRVLEGYVGNQFRVLCMARSFPGPLSLAVWCAAFSGSRGRFQGLPDPLPFGLRKDGAGSRVAGTGVSRRGGGPLFLGEVGGGGGGGGGAPDEEPVRSL